MCEPQNLTGALIGDSTSWGFVKAKAVRAPASVSGQSFIWRASICAATTAVGAMKGEGVRGGSLPGDSLMCRENCDARSGPAHGTQVSELANTQHALPSMYKKALHHVFGHAAPGRKHVEAMPKTGFTYTSILCICSRRHLSSRVAPS